MNLNSESKSNPVPLFSEFILAIIPVIKSKYLYIALLAVFAGTGLNFVSQAYLHNYISEGKTLPILSDLILDNLPYINVSLIYDISALIPIVLVITYIFHKKYETPLLITKGLQFKV